MRVSLTLEFEDGTKYDVRSRVKDMSQFMKQYRKHFGSDFDSAKSAEEGRQLDDTMFLAWVVATREGLTTDGFDDWYDKLVECDQAGPKASTSQD